MSNKIPDRWASRPFYPWLVLTLLVGAYALNWLDRFIFVILMESIKEDLNLSNTQLGLLSGFAFSAVYSLVGLPVARWADRSNRRSIIAIGLSFWSVMTAFCGLAQNFLQLAAARFGVGVGESTCSPSAYSLISDYFSQEKRATAFAIYGLGLYMGLSGGLILGGWVNEHMGWRAAFLIAGIPGLLYALLIRFVIWEPPRGHSDKGDVELSHFPVSGVIKALSARRSFLAYVIGIGLFMFSGNAIETWAPVFLIRVEGMSSSEAGTMLGLLSGTSGMIGLLVSGLIADKLSKRDLRWYVWVPAIAGLMMIPSILLFLFTPGTLKFVFYSASTFFGASYLAPIIAITQRLVPVRMRAVSSAIILLSLNFIGIGFGTLSAGILTDLLTPVYQNEAIRYALALTLTGCAVGTLFTLYAAHRLPVDLRLHNESKNNIPG